MLYLHPAVRIVSLFCVGVGSAWLVTPIGQARDAEAANKRQVEARVLHEEQRREHAERLKKVQKEAEEVASHTLHKSLAVEGGKGASLQTLTVTADGRVLALVAPPRTFGAPVKDAASEVRVLDAEGETQSI